MGTVKRAHLVRGKLKAGANRGREVRKMARADKGA